jgi:hypothetical protein
VHCLCRDNDETNRGLCARSDVTGGGEIFGTPIWFRVGDELSLPFGFLVRWNWAGDGIPQCSSSNSTSKAAGKSARSTRTGLKPGFIPILFGTAEAVPFPVEIEIESKRQRQRQKAKAKGKRQKQKAKAKSTAPAAKSRSQSYCTNSVKPVAEVIEELLAVTVML